MNFKSIIYFLNQTSFMTSNFTPNHLIKYLYKEVSASETLAIEEALDTNVALMEAYEDLLQGYQQLPKVSFNPGNAALQNVLRYSQRTALEKQA